MNISNTRPDTEFLKRRQFQPARLFHNSPYLKSLAEFFRAMKRGDTTQLLITFLLAALLVIPTATLLLAQGLNNASDNLKQARRITMFLPADTTSETSSALSTTLGSNPRVVAVSQVAPAVPTDAETPVILELVPATGLSNEGVKELAVHLRSLPGIEFVDLNTQRLDQNASAFDLLSMIARVSNIFALLIAALLTLMVSRKDVKNNKNNIDLMRQMGATNSDLRRPYLYRSLTLGLLAGLLSMAAVLAILASVVHLVDISTYKALIPSKPSLSQLALFLTIIILAGLLATSRTFTKILHKESIR